MAGKTTPAARGQVEGITGVQAPRGSMAVPAPGSGFPHAFDHTMPAPSIPGGCGPGCAEAGLMPKGSGKLNSVQPRREGPPNRKMGSGVTGLPKKNGRGPDMAGGPGVNARPKRSPSGGY